MSEVVGSVETIFRYPVKSMAGEEAEEVFVGFAGIMGDRVFAFVQPDGPKGFPWHTSREQEDLVLFRPRFVDSQRSTKPVHLEASLDMAPGVNPVYPGQNAFAIDVEVPGGATLPLTSKELRLELEERGGKPVTLRFSERGLYDCRPVSIMGNATVSRLGEELVMAVDRRRFRANFYVEWLEAKPFVENELVGRTLSIGNRVRVSVVNRDPRCKVITIDPDTGETSPRVLRHLTAVHEGTAGVYAAVICEGIVRRGDLVRVE